MFQQLRPRELCERAIGSLSHQKQSPSHLNFLSKVINSNLGLNDLRGTVEMSCGCGRSPTGKCVGWHKLTEEEYKQKLREYKAKKTKKAQAA